MINKITSGFIRILCLVFLVSIIGLSIIGIFPQGVKFGIIVLIGLLFFVFLFLVAVEKLSLPKYKLFWLSLIILGIIIRIAYAFTVNADIISDQEHCLNAAQQVARGNYTWATSDPYFERWAYQIPFVLYEGFVLRIFGTVRALYVLNGVFSVITCFLIYAIVKKIHNKNVALITMAVFSCFPLFVFSISRLYNQIIAGVFMLLAIYFFVSVCKRPYYNEPRNDFFRVLLLCALTGLFLGISNLFRTEAIIGLLAVECWFIYSFIVNIKKEKLSVLIFRLILCMLITYVVYKIVNVGVGLTIVYSGISPNGIKNGCIYWFIVCGLTPESFGAYSTKYAYITDYKDSTQQFEVFKSIIKEIFSNQNICDICTFFAKKEYYMWGEISYYSASYAPHIVYTLLNNFSHCIYILIIALSVVGLNKKRYNTVVVFLSILFLGFFFAFVIKEISSTYRYSTILIFILLSSGGINYLVEGNRTICSKIPILRRNCV